MKENIAGCQNFLYRIDMANKSMLMSWIGNADLDALKGGDSVGALARILQARKFDRLLVLNDWRDDRVARYRGWLEDRFPEYAPLSFTSITLTGPTNFAEIYTAATSLLDSQRATEWDLALNISSGTAAMQFVSIILGKIRYPRAELLEASREHGVRSADIPIEIPAEMAQEFLRPFARRAAQAADGRAPDIAHFGDIAYRCNAMRRLVERAKSTALHDESIIIFGESGSGKELLAKAIHGESRRKAKKCVAVNCGAIPPELFESEFFGHAKGSFTGATADRKGYFEQANGGTLFLDEIGELPIAAQVKLLRVLESGEIQSVGRDKLIKVDVRIIAATNLNLQHAVAEGDFRDDLYYRLMVSVLEIPPLRERKEDIEPICETLLRDLIEFRRLPRKTLLVSGLRAIEAYDWPGNVRELRNLLVRVLVEPGEPGQIGITEKDIAAALLPSYAPAGQILGQRLGPPFDVTKVTAEVERHYLLRALEESAGVKAKAAKLLGLKSAQNVIDWSKRLLEQ